MKVDDTHPSATEKPAPDRQRFQQALQQAGTRKSSNPPRTPHAPGKPAGPPVMGKTGKPAAALQRPAQSAVSTGQAIAHSRSALATPENLGRVRQGMSAESHRLQNTRAEALSVSQERTEHRVTELIARELTRDLRAEHSSARGAPPPSSAASSAASSEVEPGQVSGDSSSGLHGVRAGGSAAGAAPSESPDAQLKAQAAMELIARIEVFVKSQRPALKMSLGGALDATVEVERTGPREVALRIQGRQGPVPQEELSRIRSALEAKGLRLRSLVAG